MSGIIRLQSRDVISVFSIGGKILTDFLGGAKYEKTTFCAEKHKKVTIFKIQGGQIHPLSPPPNDVPVTETRRLHHTLPPSSLAFLPGKEKLFRPNVPTNIN